MTRNTLQKMLWILLATFFLSTVLDAAVKKKPLRFEGAAVSGEIDKFVKKLAKEGHTGFATEDSPGFCLRCDGGGVRVVAADSGNGTGRSVAGNHRPAGRFCFPAAD